MRAGQTVIVCGADGDRAQFEPFEWPAHATLWIGVGCGHVCSICYLPPSPDDATEHERVEVARAYVRAVRDPPSCESAVLALSGWLRIVERAARVPCAMIVACGGVRVSAIPIFRARYTRRTVTVVGAGIHRTVRRDGDVEMCARRVLSSRMIGASEYRIVPCGARSFELHPLELCAMCAAPIRSSFRRFTTANHADLAAVAKSAERARTMWLPKLSWLPTLSVCSACSVRTVVLWRTFHFSIDGPQIRASPTASAPIFGEGAHESVSLANLRVVETLALALAARAVPRDAFSASLASALCDLKLLRIVAEHMLPPRPRAVAHRALACLLEDHRSALG
jgi:hypothetical protein